MEIHIKNHTKLFHPDLGVDFKEGGKPKNPEKNPRSTDQLQQLYSHEFQFKLRINTRLYL